MFTSTSERVEELKQEKQELVAAQKVKEHDLQNRINFLEQENRTLQGRVDALTKKVATLRADNELLERTANRYVIKNEAYRKAAKHK